MEKIKWKMVLSLQMWHVSSKANSLTHTPNRFGKTKKNLFLEIVGSPWQLVHIPQDFVSLSCKAFVSIDEIQPHCNLELFRVSLVFVFSLKWLSSCLSIITIIISFLKLEARILPFRNLMDNSIYIWMIFKWYKK